MRFCQNKLDSAKWFIDAINKEQTLIYHDCNIEFSKKYFLTGDENKIKPMILKILPKK